MQVHNPSSIIWFSVVEEWRKEGGESWQLIEPADGFHPNQVKGAVVCVCVCVHAWGGGGVEENM